MNYIHPTALIYPGVVLGDNVYIGAYSVIGSPPEHPDLIDPREFEDVRVNIGDNVTIREFVTVHSGVEFATTIREGSYIMAHSHIGHDAYIEEKCVIHTAAIIGGFSVVGKFSRVGLNATLHQHTHIPTGTMVGAQAFVKGKWNNIFRVLAGVPAKVIGENWRLREKLEKPNNGEGEE